MSKTKILSILSGATNIEEVASPTINAQATGGVGDVFATADTKNVVSPNSIIKYFNIKLQSGIKEDVTPSHNGWIEYALVRFDEQQGVPALDAGITANIGTQTLGDLCNNLYREKCVWNGSQIISKEVPSQIDLHIKVPDAFCKNRRGTYWMFLYSLRTSKSTDTTTEIKSVYSHQYKCYI